MNRARLGTRVGGSLRGVLSAAAALLVTVSCGGSSLSPAALVGPSGVSTSTPSSPIDRSCAVPRAPGGLAVVFADTRPVGLTWAAVPDAADYVVTMGTNPGGTNVLVTNATEPSYTFGPLAPGTYHARVHSHNWCGTSDPSAEVAFTII
jgi:hypothetical protein